MELRQLRFAIRAAQASSFLRAARELNVKQTTLSKSVTALEHELGITLFERSTRGVALTDTGRPFIEVARRIITDVDNLRTTAKAVRYGEIGRLAVGFSTSLAGGNLRLLLGEMLDRHPDIQLDGVDTNSQRMTSGLDSHIIDVAVHAGTLRKTGYRRRKLWSERLMVVLPQDHQLCEADEVFWTDLRNEVFVLSTLRLGPLLAQSITNRLAGNGFEANIIMQETTAENIMAMVSFGKFLTVVPDSMLGAKRNDLRFREIKEQGVSAHLNVGAYWRSDNENPALKRFLELLDERYPEPGDAQ